jgi:SAM-dependent methyltransferase
MFQGLRWHLAKLQLSTGRGLRPRQVKIRQRKHAAKEEDFLPNTASYCLLAAYWDEYATWLVPRYGRFLSAARKYYGLPIRSVLDLACGTGLLSRQIAQRVEMVTGLDMSSAMLREARTFTEASNVNYVQADFRAFSLDATFDAAVCGGDSLNYVEAPGELADVFCCVRQQLSPGGLFIFDVLDDRAFRKLARAKTVVDVSGERFEVYYFYDADKRVSESRAVFGSAVEAHKRIPLEKADVRRAAEEAGLSVTEHFSSNTYLPLNLSLVRQFYVLRNPPT